MVDSSLLHDNLIWAFDESPEKILSQKFRKTAVDTELISIRADFWTALLGNFLAHILHDAY